MASELEQRLAALESEVRLLRDKQEIYDTLMRYCRGTDRCDDELVESTYEGYDAHKVSEVLAATTKGTMHFIGNVLINVDGDRAASETYFISYHLLEHAGKEYTRAMAGRYFHRWRRTETGWITTKRISRIEWRRLDEIDDPAPPGANWPQSWGEALKQQYVAGERSHNDPSFTWNPSEVAAGV